MKSRFNISVTEAMALYLRSDAQMAERGHPARMRNGRGSELERCERDVEAGRRPDRQRHPPPHRKTPSTGCARCSRASPASRGRSRSFWSPRDWSSRDLASETDELASLAADARATLDVLLLDVPQFDAAQSRAADHAARGSRSAGHRTRAARRRGARRAVSHQHQRGLRVRPDLARARRLLPAGRRVAPRGSQWPPTPRRRQERAPRRLDPVAPQFRDLDVGQGDHAG